MRPLLGNYSPPRVLDCFSTFLVLSAVYILLLPLPPSDIYIFPDFSTHSVSYFIEALLRHHDYTKYKVVVYSVVVKVFFSFLDFFLYMYYTFSVKAIHFLPFEQLISHGFAGICKNI